MKLGLMLLADGHLREGRLEEALAVVKPLPQDKDRDLILRQIRDTAVKMGELDLFEKASELAGLNSRAQEDLASLFLANVAKQSLTMMLRIFDLLPDTDFRERLLDAAIIESARRGHAIICERLAEKRRVSLRPDEALIAKMASVREGWISDAERAAALAGVELTKEDYTTMFIVNKDKGATEAARIVAERAEIELDEHVKVSFLLGAIKHGRSAASEIAREIDS